MIILPPYPDPNFQSVPQISLSITIDTQLTNNFTYATKNKRYPSAPSPVMNALDGMENESNTKKSEEDRIGRCRWSIAIEGF